MLVCVEELFRKASSSLRNRIEANDHMTMGTKVKAQRNACT